MGFEERLDGDLARARTRDDLIDELAAAHGLDVRLVREVFAAAERVAGEDPRGRSTVHWFRQLAGLTTDGAAPSPGRRSAVQRAYGAGVGPGGTRSAAASPGKRTLTMRLAGRSGRMAGRATGPQPLDASVRDRMGQLFGDSFTGVLVHPDSPEATGPIRAVARGEEIHFRDGAYQPGTSEGDQLIAHELAHLVQQRGGRGGRAGREGARRDLEREADVAAALVARGQSARIQLRAAAGAYAFSDEEDHEVDAGELDAEGQDGPGRDGDDTKNGGQTGSPAGQDSARSEETSDGKPEDKGDVDAGRQPETAKPVEDRPEPAEPEAVRGSDPGPAADPGAEAGGDAPGDSAGGDLRGELESAGEPVDAESDGGGGAVGGGGGAAPKPVKEAPSVAGSRPEAAFTQLRGVRPDKQAEALPGVRTAASADVDKARAKAQASPPKQLSTGESAAPTRKGGKPAAGDPGDKGPAAGAPKDGADHPIKPELPGETAAKQAKQAEATQDQKAAGQAIQGAGQASTAHFSSLPSGKAAEGDTDKMSDADAQQMAGSVDRLSADVSAIDTSAGPPPTIAMKGEATSSAASDRAELERKTTGAETQARSDSRVPMGEDDIETTVPTEELIAKPMKGQVPDVALPTAAAAASSEEVGIIAQEQHQAEIDAALDKASGDVAGERAKHEQADLQARADSERQVSQLKTQADGEQEGARKLARAEVDRARGEWQGEVDKKGLEARAKADKKIADGMVEVENEEEKANTEARKHIDDGKRQADEEKQKGEREAEEAKKKGEEKSSGFWGWVKSKAKALVDGIKKAITAVIDTVKKAVKAVIEAAKKLAMAAIELARKAIVAVIQAIGKALLAITDVLLAAFPELKARFQKAIRGMVDKAVDTVNRVADGLKRAVQKALDLLGAALDKALGLLEKGLHFIVDAAGAVIQAAIKAAEAVANTLGVWAKLIKDVATGPGSWIGKLGAAVVDGIKNHLWAALKTAVISWFQSKVFELLGLGGLILQILLDGGITTDDITRMAIQALIVAIPVILVTILVEKLVSMIVPAAGAVIAIVEGLMAAWGTVSRIIAAFGAFVAFLLAVKGGGAGPLFAGLLAAAAVVVLDFVANWLLRKLAGPARKVGAKLKKVAEKFKNRRKPKRPGAKDDDGKSGSPSRKDKDGPEGTAPRKDRDRDENDRHRGDRPPDDRSRREAERRQEADQRDKQRRLKRGLRIARARLRALLRRGASPAALQGDLPAIASSAGLTRLWIVNSGDSWTARGQVNPEGVADKGVIAKAARMHRASQLAQRDVLADQTIRERAEDLRGQFASQRSLPGSSAVPLRTAEDQIAAGVIFREGNAGTGRVTIGQSSGVEASFTQLRGNAIFVRGLGSSQRILSELTAGARRLGMTDGQLAAEIERFSHTGELDPRIRRDDRLRDAIGRDLFRQHAVEPVRIPTHLSDRAGALERAAQPGGSIGQLETSADIARTRGEHSGAVAGHRAAEGMLQRHEQGQAEPTRDSMARRAGRMVLEAAAAEEDRLSGQLFETPEALVQVLVERIKKRVLGRGS